MSKKTKIQWCDSTINPIMGCAGCELYPTAEFLLKEIDFELIKSKVTGWKEGMARQYFEQVLAKAWQELLGVIGQPDLGHKNEMTSTNIYHLRVLLGDTIAKECGKEAGKIVIAAIENNRRCYAAQLHSNRAYNMIKPDRKVNRGYAPTFEQVTPYPGRLTDAAKWSDLTETKRPDKPWLNGLPRLIFVSDIGDAFSRRLDFDFLQEEISVFQNPMGRRHLWLWLTKQPNIMRQFADSIGGFPSNVCAMTTVTSTKTLSRIDALRKVNAPVRGLSIEPLWGSVAARLDLSDIDWVIVGGESGAKARVHPFHLEWALEIQNLCRDQGIPFFMKQYGLRPFQNEQELELTDSHGGDWDEWMSELKVREMPQYFYDYAKIDHLPVAS